MISAVSRWPPGDDFAKMMFGCGVWSSIRNTATTAVYSVSTNTAHTTVSIRYALLSTSAMNYV